ncbi:MAG: ADP-glyceromanno-heptose 6-epimerase [Planctomycetes bacterium]|nr:ADP-glyceromanno-heptose 6-epimerase [Planctomycetota bacterium]
MFVVTGGAGFVGSHLVHRLNADGVDAILVVDDLSCGTKASNLADCRVADYMDKDEFLLALERGKLPQLTTIFHQGACTNTRELDGRYLMRNNYRFSRETLHYALEHAVPFVYASSASVYGANQTFREEPAFERPINPYAFSKLVFDQHVRQVMRRAKSTVVGLRYFNVYGPREQHKGDMASMAYQLYTQIKREGRARLFEGTSGYGPGEQRRDFVFVEDAVSVNLFFARGAPQQGIFNVGSGVSRSYNDLARTVIDTLGTGEVTYIPFDDRLRGRYQSYTQADLSRLREAGYEGAFTAIEDGVPVAVRSWEGDPLTTPQLAANPVR